MGQAITAKIKLDTYCDLNFNEVKGELVPEVEVNIYEEQGDEAIICIKNKLDDLLEKLILDNSIPSNPPTTKNKYKNELMEYLQSLRQSVDRAEAMLNKMVNLDELDEKVEKKSTKAKTPTKKFKK